MPIHWTYDEKPSKEDDLRQGDILFPEETLRAIFNEVHPHFSDNKYVAFVILTQSCDLVRRKGKGCSATHISLAVVRTLESILPTLLEKCCEKVCENIYIEETKGKAIDLLHRILNQNEQALGLFYLHTDLDAGIATPSVVLLRVTISLRSEHYQILQNSRCGRLLPEFVPKLGWLVGNLYSRVGTPDWEEKDLEIIIDEHLTGPKGEASPKQPLWIKKSWVDAARKAGVIFDNLSHKSVLEELGKHKPKEAKEVLIDTIDVILKKRLPAVCDSYCEVKPDVFDAWLETQLKKIGNLLRNDGDLIKLLKKDT